MINYAARLAGAATLALAALPMVALATTAHAAPATIQVRDLDLGTAAGRDTFERRADRAAESFCKAQKRPASRVRAAEAECIAAVKAEVAEKFTVALAAQKAQRGVYATR
ncbi:UrcA family protein [Phenylobacterium sp.]|jgi:UrcA family protein|uniref:UrcA family protein n=1 Tax=Phenylobacterium sp. TaxID=1871053 RepID=UPI002F923D8C